ncbi:hypothetical protein MTO96_040088 [Rhipicephalus appendiculatus]
MPCGVASVAVLPVRGGGVRPTWFRKAAWFRGACAEPKLNVASRPSTLPCAFVLPDHQAEPLGRWRRASSRARPLVAVSGAALQRRDSAYVTYSTHLSVTHTARPRRRSCRPVAPEWRRRDLPQPPAVRRAPASHRLCGVRFATDAENHAHGAVCLCNVRTQRRAGCLVACVLDPARDIFKSHTRPPASPDGGAPLHGAGGFGFAASWFPPRSVSL